MSSFISKASSKSSSSASISDVASTHSSVSTATTLKGMDMHKKKWYSLSSKSHPKHANDYYVKKALHNEAVASYFSMR
ncbi:hypothetical protein PDE_09225 [Penicillium oxalicum 114-2]|uniref:Uncharacterized protein n=1 Tax=Penicillium oxalicum (strain 114-2 / CGMCC 5302) TaxID=933388 RepID=S7ZZI7_PENO1|nr:hypothetical protein PDE_09225 [Penicillium oxalicum 114-2]